MRTRNWQSYLLDIRKWLVSSTYTK